MPSTSTQQTDLVNFALLGIDLQIKQLEEKRRELAALLPGKVHSARLDRSLETSEREEPEIASPRKKRKVSVATRAKLKASAKARWARVKKQAGKSAARQQQPTARVAKRVSAQRRSPKEKAPSEVTPSSARGRK